jgi:putative membrane protein
MVKSLAAGTIIATALLGGTVAFAQMNPPAATPPAQASAPTRLNAQEQQFVQQAAIGGMFEVAAGRVAEKSTNASVRQFGARMVRDHSAAGNRLKQVVTSEGGEVPQALDQTHLQKLDQLGALKGDDFSRAYMQEMVQDHDQDMQAFAQAIPTLTDPRLKRWAQETLTVVKQHDLMAHQIDSKLAAASAH